MKLAILDRDGVINYDSDAFIKHPDEWIALPGSLDAIARLAQAGWRSRDHVVLYLFAKTVLPFCLGILSEVLSVLSEVFCSQRRCWLFSSEFLR